MELDDLAKRRRQTANGQNWHREGGKKLKLKEFKGREENAGRGSEIWEGGELM